MKLAILKEIIKKKQNKSEFAIVTDLTTGESEIYENNKPLSKLFENYSKQIINFYDLINWFYQQIFIFNKKVIFWKSFP